MQIHCEKGSLLDIKWLGSFGCAVILEQKLEDLGFVRETMDFVVYVSERVVDIIAALILRAGYRWIDQFFVVAGTNGEAGDLWVPLGTPVRTGSGGALSLIGGRGSHRNSTGDQPADGSENVIGGDSIVLDFPSLD